MDELKFVLKCFLFACALLTLTQLKTNGLTIESRIQNSLLNTAVADFLNQTAAGGVKLVKNLSVKTKETVQGWMNTSGGGESRKKPTNDEISPEADFESDVE